MTPKHQHAALKIAVKHALVVLDRPWRDSEMRFLNVFQVWSRASEDAGWPYDTIARPDRAHSSRDRAGGDRGRLAGLVDESATAE
jgi:hypothetical protein